MRRLIPGRIRNQDNNGVKVRVHEHANGTVVHADCQCFGSPMRLHTNAYCPVLTAQRPKPWEA